MNLTATHINYYHVCRRKLWLFSNGIQMEHTSDLVAEGKQIGKNTYPQRAERYQELQIGNIKIDFYDAKNKVVHEIKKSRAKSAAHIAQVKYYLYILEQIGIENPTGILEYPTLRDTEPVFLTETDRSDIRRWETDIETIIFAETVPQKLTRSKCTKCSYFEFCWTGQE